MRQYLLRRVALMLPVLFLVSVIAFTLLRLSPGDPARIYAGEELDQEYVERVRVDLGLDKPIPVQYVIWLGHVARGDLGFSILKHRPVGQLLADAVPRTLELGLVALLIHASIGMVIGILAALKRDSVLDLLSTTAALALISVPSFVVAFILILVFALALRALPAGGFVPFSEDPIAHLRSLVLPALAVGAGSLASIMRHTRSSLLETMGDDYIRTARAKGLRGGVVVRRHALRNALIPVATLIGLQVGALIEGAFIVETIFAWPGIGRLTIDSINARDYSVVQAAVLLAAVSFMLATLITDAAYSWLDPRISYGDRSHG